MWAQRGQDMERSRRGTQRALFHSPKFHVTKMPTPDALTLSEEPEAV